MTPFTQMVAEQNSAGAACGLSQADQKVMQNPRLPLGNFRGEMVRNAAQDIIDAASATPSAVAGGLCSDKLLQRQRKMKADADEDLKAILQAQSGRRTELAFPKPGLGSRIPQHAPAAVLPRMGDATLDDAQERLKCAIEANSRGAPTKERRGIRPRPSSLPSLYDEDTRGTESCGRQSAAKRSRQQRRSSAAGEMEGSFIRSQQGDQLDDMEFEEIPESEPVNRAVPAKPKEPETEEERAQALINKACSLCRHGRTSDVKQLLQEGLALDAQDDHGNTMLIISCQNNQKKLVKLLVKQGADSTITNLKGHDASHYARLYKCLLVSLCGGAVLTSPSCVRHEELLRYLAD